MKLFRTRAAKELRSEQEKDPLRILFLINVIGIVILF